MEDKLLKGILHFDEQEIGEVYTHCFFKFVENKTAIIYHMQEDEDDEMYIEFYVLDEDDSTMIIKDIATGQITSLHTQGDSGVSSEDDRITDDVASSIVSKFLGLAESFVGFISAED